MLSTKVQDVYEVALPISVQRFISYATFVVSFGLGSSTSLVTCLGFSGFYWRLVLWMLVPPVAIGTILVCCVARLLYKRNLSRMALVESALPPTVRALVSPRRDPKHSLLMLL